MPYTKLDAGLVHSTVWREPDAVRIVWITMLAMADRHGEVMASVPGLMDVARVSRADVDRALKLFLSPDPDSRTKAFDGRRIEVIPGGWLLLNHGEHRRRGDAEDRKAKAAARQKRFRERHKADLAPVLDGFDAEPPAGTVTQKRYGGVTGNAPSQEVTTSSKQSPEADTELQTTTTSAARAKPNWLSPYLAIWREFCPKVKDKAIAGQLAKAVKPLIDDHGEPEICEQLANYLTQVGTQYASPAGFARAFGTWTGKRQRGAGESKQEHGRQELGKYLNQRRADGNPERGRGDARLLPRALPDAKR